jgi:preprotein translocase subunit SecG
MFKAAIALHITVSIVLIITVLLQGGKGASIGSTFGGTSSQAIFGTSGPTTILTKVGKGSAR